MDNVPIAAVWPQLGVREKRVLERIANRLLAGQRMYGELHVGKKNWKREAQEEAMDASVYMAAALEDDDDIQSLEEETEQAPDTVRETPHAKADTDR